ncbi:ABC transporter substrate-binding protein [Plantactinospora sp. WMMB782]|uniref:ABC transporter substrate-binding protein n=1 Tax=Plantactinospora sp. WMMB782 TaxID=3404121 RepID=UPI003B92B201
MRERATRPRTSWRAVAPLSIVVICAVLAAGCAADPDTPVAAPSTGPVTVTNCGVPVRVAEPPSRVVTLNQAATEIMLALGLQDRMVGTAYLDDTILPEYAAAYAKIPVLAKEYPAKEKLIEATPDFVYASFASAFSDEGVGDRGAFTGLGVGTYLSPAGCPTETRPSPLTIDHVFGEIRDIAAIFGVPDRATALIDGQKARITAAVSSVRDAKETSVLWWDAGTDAPSVGACCGGPGMVLAAIGVTNTFADITGSWGDTSWEKVIERDPDVIVLVDAEWDRAEAKRTFLTGHAALRDLPAVAGQRFVVIPFSETAAGVRNVLGVERLAKGLTALPARVGS